VSVPLNLVATAAAILVTAFLLVLANAGSHAVARRGRVLSDVVEQLSPQGDGEVSAQARVPGARRVVLNVEVSARPEVPESRLLYIKPSLTGHEPEDVLDYHRRHPDFPQETTADQFFDEAQWESYRRLGQHVADEIFGAPVTSPTAPGTWDPRKLEYRPAGREGSSNTVL
jgi:hypothetical protein